MNLLQQTPLFQELTRDIVLEAEQRGEPRGEQRGRVQTLLRLLERRLGSVPEDLQQQLQQVTDIARLEKLTDAAIEVATLDDFRTHL